MRLGGEKGECLGQVFPPEEWGCQIEFLSRPLPISDTPSGPQPLLWSPKLSKAYNREGFDLASRMRSTSELWGRQGPTGSACLLLPPSLA